MLHEDTKLEDNNSSELRVLRASVVKWLLGEFCGYHHCQIAFAIYSP